MKNAIMKLFYQKFLQRHPRSEKRMQKFADSLIDFLGLESEIRYCVHNQRIVHMAAGEEHPVYCPIIYQYIRYRLGSEEYTECPQSEKLWKEVNDLKRIYAIEA